MERPCKSLWRGIYDHGIWSSIIQEKYLGRKNLSFWIRKACIGPAHGSPIWLSLRKVEKLFLKNLIWQFESRDRILVGRDSFLCGKEEICIPDFLLDFLHRKGIFFGMVWLAVGKALFLSRVRLKVWICRWILLYHGIILNLSSEMVGFFEQLNMTTSYGGTLMGWNPSMFGIYIGYWFLMVGNKVSLLFQAFSGKQDASLKWFSFPRDIS